MTTTNNPPEVLAEILAGLDCDESRTLARSVLRTLVDWICNQATHARFLNENIGRRAVALQWALRPDYFSGVSLATVARSMGIPKQRLSPHSAEAHRKWGIVNRGQAHARGSFIPNPKQ